METCSRELIETYNLDNNSKVLDVGCGKGFLLHELKLILPDIKVVGFDISEHGINQSTDLVKKFIYT